MFAGLIGDTLCPCCVFGMSDPSARGRAFACEADPAPVKVLRRLILKRLQVMLINPAAFVKPAYAERLSRAMEAFDEGRFRRLAALFVAHDTWHCPTLVRLRTQELGDAPEYAQHPDLEYMPSKSVQAWRRVTARFKRLPAETRRVFRAAYPASSS